MHGVIITKRSFEDLKDDQKAKEIVRAALDCSTTDFCEVHKFEEHVAGCMVLRAKKRTNAYSLLRGLCCL